MPQSLRNWVCLDLRDLALALLFSSGFISVLETKVDALGGAKSSSGARTVFNAEVGGKADSRVVAGRLDIVVI